MYHYVRIGHFCRLYLFAAFAYVRVHIVLQVRVYVGAGPSGGGGGGGGGRGGHGPVVPPPLDPLLPYRTSNHRWSNAPLLRNTKLITIFNQQSRVYNEFTQDPTLL